MHTLVDLCGLNFDKYKECGGDALIDRRIGQQQDYKFNSKVKAEIINNLINNILMNVIPTKSTIGKGAHFKKGGKIFPTRYNWKSFNNKLLKDYCRIP